jgi:DinB superfamily
MNETAAQYAQKLRTFLGSKDPLQSLREMPAVLKQLLQTASDDLTRTTPAPGKWSVRQIVAHLADSELVTGYRYRSILGADNGSPVPAYDQNRWAEAGNYADVPIADSLASFTALRQINLRLLESLPANAWDKYGLHAERGRESIRDLVQLAAGHDLNHLAQIRKILGAAQAA